jgi:hypothetical protein
VAEKPATGGMEVRISLQYPNGRTHEETIERDAPLEPGDEFELYGHRWRAIRLIQPGISSGTAAMLCRPN